MAMFSRAARWLLSLGCLLSLVAAAHAMSVVAPTFDQLVQDATTVFRGTVTDVHSVTVDTPQGSAIRTLVTFQVERALKGSPQPQVTLSFLGGKVGHRNMHVLGMPTFAVGQREIVFVGAEGNSVCPLLAAGHGRYHVRHDVKTGHEYVARENNTPLTSTDDVAKPLEANTAAASTNSATALTSDEFETRIITATRGNSRRVQP